MQKKESTKIVTDTLTLYVQLCQFSVWFYLSNSNLIFLKDVRLFLAFSLVEKGSGFSHENMAKLPGIKVTIGFTYGCNVLIRKDKKVTPYVY